VAQEQILEDEVPAWTNAGQDGREQQPEEFKHAFSIADPPPPEDLPSPHRLCQRRLTWRATFFDLEAGTLHYVHADPHDIANLLRIRTDSVLRRQRWVATARA